MNKAKILFASGLSLMVAACGAMSPDAADGRAAFEGAVSKELRGARFAVTSFEKTDGQSAEVNGVPNYTLFFSATVSYPDGYRSECLQEFVGMQGFQIGMACSGDFMFAKTPFRPANPGETVDVKGTIRFAKTENGWMAGQTMFEPPARKES